MQKALRIVFASDDFPKYTRYPSVRVQIFIDATHQCQQFVRVFAFCHFKTSVPHLHFTFAIRVHRLRAEIIVHVHFNLIQSAAQDTHVS